MELAFLERRIELSLCGERSVYVRQAVKDPSEYISRVRQRFESERIKPMLRTVALERDVASLDRLSGDYSVYFVTEGDPLSVFFDPISNCFGAAWGPELGTGRYVDLGFRSDDVLEMASA